MRAAPEKRKPDAATSGFQKGVKAVRASDEDQNSGSSISPQLRWNRANPQARKAHAAVAKGIKAGKLEKEGCSATGCLVGPEGTQAHHWSYEPEYWLRPVWLCPLHHRRHHAICRKLGGKP